MSKHSRSSREWWHIYSRIKELRALGLNRSQAARNAGVNVKTVNKYWDLDVDGYLQLVETSAHHKSRLDGYENVISGWLHQYPDMSGAQVHDWLKERYPKYKASERSARRYVSRLRRRLGLEKQSFACVSGHSWPHQVCVEFTFELKLN